MKPLAVAKSRLSQALRPRERRALAFAMYRDVLEALFRSESIDRIAVISSDPMILKHAQQMNALGIEETQIIGLNTAVNHGTHRCLLAGATSVLTVLADLPLLTSEEIDQLYQDLPSGPHMRLVPSHDGHGTNALLRQPPEVISTRFGVKSFEDHIIAAADAGIPYSVKNISGLSVDIDTIDDLLALSAPSHPTRTFSEAQRLGLLPYSVFPECSQ